MVDMPYDDPEPVASRPQLDAKIAEVERDCHVDVALFGTLNDKHGMQAAAGLIEGGVCAFKFSTFEATPGRFPRVDEDDLYEAFRLIAPSGLVCGVHNQMQELTRKNIKRLIDAGDTGWDAFMRAHTPLIENLATALIYEYAPNRMPAHMRCMCRPRVVSNCATCIARPAITARLKPASNI